MVDWKGCISLKLFDSVVRYGADYPSAGYEAKNKGKSAPNAPYAPNPKF
ncbi:hypothetical protein LYNGBM3L_42190 [Moorena producens 3L]|uniref:Uncharacterized protein n=1 Tax=Moorena producens 3L TaxID=489825 RepID=F4XW15_9CYAN|nr:hypothetical protein LYNGBM3L_42190 [Moorena producens 3L]